MTNYERIKQMSIEEMVELLGNGDICKHCKYGDKVCFCFEWITCEMGIRDWLNNEVENNDR